MKFSPFNAHTRTFFKNCNILKLVDIINAESYVFINNCFNKDPYSSFFFSLLFFILHCCKVLFPIIFFLFFLKNYGKNSKNKEKKN